MAACANGAHYRACPPLKVAREFHRADQGLGGSKPMQSGLEAKMNFGQGHGHNFFSTTPLMGHALSGSLGKADHSTRHAQRRFADGGEVKKPAGPSAKERQQIRELIERGKADAISALRTTRSALLSGGPSEPGDIASSLDDLSGRLAMKEGGAVDTDSDNPEMMYEQYMQLLDKLQDPQLDADTQMQIVDRLAQLGSDLEAVGIDVDQDDPAPEVGEDAAPDRQPSALQMAEGGSVGPIPRRTVADKILGLYGDALSWTGDKATRLGSQMKTVTPLSASLALALQGTGPAIADSGHAFQDWSKGFSPIHSSGEITQPVVNREQLVNIVGGLPPMAEASRAVPGAIRHAAEDFMTAQVGGLPRVTAYHGSPHTFDTFDTSKIGTGEGAQAYGHGLYFAESPGVAGKYQTTTSYQNMARDFRNSLPDDAEADEVLEMASAGELNPKQARVIKALAADDWLGFDYPAQAITAAFKEAAFKKGNFELSDELKAAMKEYGHLYTVDIPDEHIARMLDWDKLLKEHPESIKKALAAADFNNDPVIAAWKQNGTWDHVTGRDLYARLAGGLTYGAAEQGLPKRASEYLNSLGIPGLKYLDAASRGTGKGTRNFVVFDDTIPKVLKRE